MDDSLSTFSNISRSTFDSPSRQAIRYITEAYLRTVTKGAPASKVKNLTLSPNHKSNEKIKFIENLNDFNNLEILDLHNNVICKLENLQHLSRLRVLNLSHNNIKKIENIDSLYRLEELNLSHNNIERIPKIIEKLPRISILRLDYNNLSVIKDIKHLRSLEGLSNLSIHPNPFCKHPHFRKYVIYWLTNLAILDGESISLEERQEADNQFNRKEIENLERELNQQMKKVDSLSNELNQKEKELDKYKKLEDKLNQQIQQVEDKNYSIEKELETKDVLLDKKTRELIYCSSLIQRLQQELQILRFKQNEVSQNSFTEQKDAEESVSMSYSELPIENKRQYKNKFPSNVSIEEWEELSTESIEVREASIQTSNEFDISFTANWAYNTENYNLFEKLEKNKLSQINMREAEIQTLDSSSYMKEFSKTQISQNDLPIYPLSDTNNNTFSNDNADKNFSEIEKELKDQISELQIVTNDQEEELSHYKKLVDELSNREKEYIQLLNFDENEEYAKSGQVWDKFDQRLRSNNNYTNHFSYNTSEDTDFFFDNIPSDNEDLLNSSLHVNDPLPQTNEDFKIYSRSHKSSLSQEDFEIITVTPTENQYKEHIKDLSKQIEKMKRRINVDKLSEEVQCKFEDQVNASSDSTQTFNPLLMDTKQQTHDIAMKNVLQQTYHTDLFLIEALSDKQSQSFLPQTMNSFAVQVEPKIDLKESMQQTEEFSSRSISQQTDQEEFSNDKIHVDEMVQIGKPISEASNITVQTETFSSRSISQQTYQTEFSKDKVNIDEIVQIGEPINKMSNITVQTRFATKSDQDNLGRNIGVQITSSQLLQFGASNEIGIQNASNETVPTVEQDVHPESSSSSWFSTGEWSEWSLSGESSSSFASDVLYQGENMGSKSLESKTLLGSENQTNTFLQLAEVPLDDYQIPKQNQLEQQKQEIIDIQPKHEPNKEISEKLIQIQEPSIEQDKPIRKFYVNKIIQEEPKKSSKALSPIFDSPENRNESVSALLDDEFIKHEEPKKLSRALSPIFFPPEHKNKSVSATSDDSLTESEEPKKSSIALSPISTSPEYETESASAISYDDFIEHEEPKRSSRALSPIFTSPEHKNESVSAIPNNGYEEPKRSSRALSPIRFSPENKNKSVSVIPDDDFSEYEEPKKSSIALSPISTSPEYETESASAISYDDFIEHEGPKRSSRALSPIFVSSKNSEESVSAISNDSFIEYEEPDKLSRALSPIFSSSQYKNKSVSAAPDDSSIESKVPKKMSRALSPIFTSIEHKNKSVSAIPDNSLTEKKDVQVSPKMSNMIIQTETNKLQKEIKIQTEFLEKPVHYRAQTTNDKFKNTETKSINTEDQSFNYSYNSSDAQQSQQHDVSTQCITYITTYTDDEYLLSSLNSSSVGSQLMANPTTGRITIPSYLVESPEVYPYVKLRKISSRDTRLKVLSQWIQQTKEIMIYSENLLEDINQDTLIISTRRKNKIRKLILSLRKPKISKITPSFESRSDKLRKEENQKPISQESIKSTSTTSSSRRRKVYRKKNNTNSTPNSSKNNKSNPTNKQMLDSTTMGLPVHPPRSQQNHSQHKDGNSNEYSDPMNYFQHENNSVITNSSGSSASHYEDLKNIRKDVESLKTSVESWNKSTTESNNEILNSDLDNNDYENYDYIYSRKSKTSNLSNNNIKYQDIREKNLYQDSSINLEKQHQHLRDKIGSHMRFLDMMDLDEQ